MCTLTAFRHQIMSHFELCGTSPRRKNETRTLSGISSGLISNFQVIKLTFVNVNSKGLFNFSHVEIRCNAI